MGPVHAPSENVSSEAYDFVVCELGGFQLFMKNVFRHKLWIWLPSMIAEGDQNSAGSIAHFTPIFQLLQEQNKIERKATRTATEHVPVTSLNHGIEPLHADGCRLDIANAGFDRAAMSREPVQKRKILDRASRFSDGEFRNGLFPVISTR